MAFDSSFALGRLSDLLTFPMPDVSIGLRDVIRSIESIHQVPSTPLLVPVNRESAYPGEGAYYDLPNKPLRIVVAPIARYPELTLVHEVGHLLDHQLLGIPWSYASEDLSLLTEWREKVRSSEAFQTLTATLVSIQQGLSEATIDKPDGTTRTLPLNIRMVQYFLEPRELFARSYAQYIVLCSQHSILKHQMNIRKSADLEAVVPQQWEDEDFEPIAEAFNRMLRERGWKL